MHQQVKILIQFYLAQKRLVRNFTNSGRRKLPNRNSYIEVLPEMIEFQKNLESMGLTREELVDTGILIGGQIFNPDGFERVGPKKPPLR